MGILKIFFLFSIIAISNEKLKIVQPDDLKNQFNYEIIKASYGRFGKIADGYNTRGRVYIPSEKTGDEVDPNYSCKPLSIDLTKSPIFDLADYFPIILVSKGNCSFTTIARRIQEAGGRLGLIINNNYGDPQDVPVLDDGSGSDIKIPIALISLEDGGKIKKYIQNHPNTSVQMDIEFSFHKTEIVNLDFYINIVDPESFKLLNSFKEYFLKIKDNVNLKIYYITFSIDGLDAEEQKNLCISQGKYCFNNRLPKSTNYNGRDLILDSLFHQCFYNVCSENGENKYHPEYYFDFIDEYYNNCLFEKTYTNFCGSKLSTIDQNQIKNTYKCMINSFGYDTKEYEDFRTISYEKENTIFKENIMKVSSKQIRQFPTVEINNKIFDGFIDAEQIFLSICSSFSYTHESCSSYIETRKNGSAIKWGLIIAIIIIFIAINIVIIFVCRKYLVKKINERFSNGIFDIDGKINSVVGSYFALKDKSSI